jgi:hypothetical protein
MKIAICTIIKQENLYLRDWVEYYLKMGVSNIILYDNNDINGEFPQHVIGDYIKSGVVIYENARGLHRYQIEAYNNCYEKYKNVFEWIGFLDADEFWYLSPEFTFDTYFTEDRFPNAIAVFLCWINYGDCGKIHYENKPVWERFPNPSQPLNIISNGSDINKVRKVFLKCYCDIEVEFKDVNWIKYWVPENMDLKNAYSSDGTEYNNNLPSNYTYSYIKHYRTLTIEEFLYRRFCRKGYADHASFHNKDFIMKLFWEQNKWTK